MYDCKCTLYDDQSSRLCYACLFYSCECVFVFVYILYADFNSNRCYNNNQNGEKYWRNISTLVFYAAILFHLLNELCIYCGGCCCCCSCCLHLLLNISSRQYSLVCYIYFILGTSVVLTFWQPMKINLQCVKSYTYYRFCDVCTQFSNWTVCCRCCCHAFTLYALCVLCVPSMEIRFFRYCLPAP